MNRHHGLATLGSFLLFVACDSGSAIESTSGMLARLEALETETQSLRERVTVLESQREALQTALASKVDTSTLAGYATRDELEQVAAPDLSAYATMAWVEAKGYATGSWVTDQGYTTESWVTNQGYATQSWITAQDYTTEEWVTSQGYATRSWVTSQGYTTESWVTNQSHATQSWVQAALDDLATESWVEERLADLVPSSALDDVVRLIRDHRTLDVPSQDFPTIASALSWLDGYAIARDASVTIKLADGTYPLAQQLEVSHRDGARLRIVGNPSNPAGVVLSAASGGLRVRNNRALGWLEGVTLRGSNAAGTDGIDVVDGGFLRVGKSDMANTQPSIIVENFGYAGLFAFREGTLFADYALVRNNGQSGAEAGEGGTLRARFARAESNGYVGFAVYNGGTLRAQNSVASGNGFSGYEVSAAVMDVRNSRAENNGTGELQNGGGFAAYHGAALRADGSTSTGNAGHGFSAWNGSAIGAQQTWATNNRNDGYFAQMGSALVANQASASGNRRNGFSALQGSALHCHDCVSTNNGDAGFHISMNSVIQGWRTRAEDNGGDGYRAWLNSGANVYDSQSLGNSHIGFAADMNSAIHAFLSVAEGNGSHGFTSNQSSALMAAGAVAADNALVGFETNVGGVIEADFATASGNGWAAFVARLNSTIDGVGATLIGNSHTGGFDDVIHCAGGYCFFEWINASGNLASVVANVFWGGHLNVSNSEITVPNPTTQFISWREPDDDDGSDYVFYTGGTNPPTPWWDVDD